MRILFCNYEYPPLGGGGGVINAWLAEALAERHEITVLTSQGFNLPSERLENGVRVVRVPVLGRRQQAAASFFSMLSYLLIAIREGRALLAREPFDIINTHFVLPTGPVGDALARFAQLPNVLSVHGGDLYDPSKWSSPHRHAVLRVWVRHLLHRANRVVGQSSNTLDNLHQVYDSELAALKIPLGIKRPPDSMPIVWRSDYGLKDEHVVLATVGRLVARKGIDQLIDLMGQWDDRVHLLLIGSGPLMDELKAQAARLGVADRVHFAGFVSEAEKLALLKMSDLYVSTSQHEGFGLVFLEAMAAGLPVVCYNHGGQVDFLEDGQTGYLVKLNDQAVFRERCQRLIRSPQLRQQMGAFNLKQVEHYFIDHCASRYEAVFEEVIARRKGLPGIADSVTGSPSANKITGR